MHEAKMFDWKKIYILIYIMILRLDFYKAVEIGPDAPSEILTSSQYNHYGGWTQHEPTHYGNGNHYNPHDYSPQNDMHNALNYGGYHAPPSHHEFGESNGYGPPSHKMHHQGGEGMHHQGGESMHHQGGGGMHHEGGGEMHHEGGGEMHHEGGGETHHECGRECGEEGMGHHQTSPYNDGHHGHHGEAGDHGGDHEVDMYGNEINYHGHALVVGDQYKGHHEHTHMPPPAPPAEGHEQEVISNADPQHIGQVGSFQEPGLGGHGPYRGPTSHHYGHEHHEEPVQVVIRPPPPEHGQNPYEVLTSSQLEPPPHHHDDTIVQMQWQDSHSQGEHFGPVYNVRDPERERSMEDFGNTQYRRCKNKKCKKLKSSKKSSHSVFDLINKNKVKPSKPSGSHNKTNSIATVPVKEKHANERKVKPITRHIKRTKTHFPRNKILKTLYKKISSKRFMSPDENPYNHRVVGVLGNMIPEATHRNNHSSLDSNTNNFELGDARHYDAVVSLRPPTPFGEEEEPYTSDDHHPPSSRGHDNDDSPSSYDDDSPSNSFNNDRPSSFNDNEGPSSHHHHRPSSREHDGPSSSFDHFPSSSYGNNRPSYDNDGPNSFDNDDDRPSREHDSPSNSYDNGPSYHGHGSPSNSYGDGPSSHGNDYPSHSFNDGPSSREHNSPSNSFDDGPSSREHNSPSNSYDDGPSSREHDSPSGLYENNLPSNNYDNDDDSPYQGNNGDYECDKRSCIKKKKSKKKTKKKYNKKKAQRKQRKMEKFYSSKKKKWNSKKVNRWKAKHHKKSNIHPNLHNLYKSKKPVMESPKKKTIFPIDHVKSFNFYNAFDRYSQRYYPNDITDKRLNNYRAQFNRVSKTSPITEFLPTISFYQPVQHQKMYDLFEQSFTDDYVPIKHTIS